MKAWTHKNYMAAIEFDPEDEIFTGRLLGINDVVSFHASTVKELKAAFHEAVDDYIELCAKTGKQPEKQMSGNLMLRVEPEVHANAIIAAELAGKSLNQWGEEVIRAATGQFVDRSALATKTKEKTKSRRRA
jgi:predicted HicB family RNase H-like nuclease